MLHDFYKLGALQALVDAGVVKQAFLGTVAKAAPIVAENVAKKHLVGTLRSGLREDLGLETPEWRAKGTLDIPELVAAKAGVPTEEVREVASDTVQDLLTQLQPPPVQPAEVVEEAT